MAERVLVVPLEALAAFAVPGPLELQVPVLTEAAAAEAETSAILVLRVVLGLAGPAKAVTAATAG